MGLNKQYVKLLGTIMKRGYVYDDPNRKGVQRRQIDDYKFEIDNKEGELPFITCKRTYPTLAYKELFLFLSGETSITKYWELGVNFWDKDLERYNTKELGDKNNYTLIGIYPELMRRWRNHDGVVVDQIRNMVNTLGTIPTATKKIVTMWNPGTRCILTPCHTSFEFLFNPSTNTLSLKWTQSSVDVFLGLPMNIYYYNMMLHIFCREFGFKVGKLIGNLSNVHLYDNSWEAVEEIIRKDKWKLWREEYSINKSFHKDTLIKTLWGDYVSPDFNSCSYTSTKSFLGVKYRTKCKEKPKGIPVYNVEMLTYS